MSEPDFYFFGALREAGHFLYSHPGHKAYGHEPIPWGWEIDASMAPQDKKDENGAGLIHRKEGWTAVSFWDRTIDKRGNSNSALIAKGDLTLDQLLQIFEQRFPERAAAINFEIEAREVTDD